MKHIQLSRRQLLLATGLTGSGLFLPSIFPGRVRAQSGPIKRIVIMTQDHGPVRETWSMRRGNPEGAGWQYNLDDSDPMSFSESLRPLHPHRDKLLVLEGLAMASAISEPLADNHVYARMHLLTGAATVGGNHGSGGPSVDQVIARAVAQPGRLPSVEFASQYLSHEGFLNAAPGQRVPYETDPAAGFSRLFPAGLDLGGGPSDRELIQASRRSVLDLVWNEFNQVAPRLGREDRMRIEQHRDHIRSLEQRMAGLSMLDCGRPDAPNDSARQLDKVRAFSDMVAAAFACDLTRVATIQISQLGNEEFGAPAGDMHQDYAHQIENDPVARQQMTNYTRVHAEALAHLIGALEQYSEGEGTLLDNTLVVWMTELATGDHQLDRIPMVLAGSCGGHFRTGRYISFAQDQALPQLDAEVGSPDIGPAHNRALVSMMQAMGLPDNQIGMAGAATRGGTMDFRNPLPGLT